MGPLKEQLYKHWQSYSSGQKMGIIALGCLLLTVCMYAVVVNSQAEYRVLFRNMDMESASEVIDFLKQEKVPFKLQGQNTILVPAEQIHQLRLQLAGKGLPKSGGVGFEIFDSSSFGSTEFVQQLNYTRALQGELSRSISSLEQVTSAKVHIARPKRSIFVRKDKKTTASVMLKMRPGFQLTHGQIRGITFLVSSAVEGLNASDVTVLNSEGKLLSQKNSSEDDYLMSKRMEAQKSVEKHLSQKAQMMLDKILGPSKAIVLVNAELDFTKIRETQERYDPEKQTIQSETVRTSKSSESFPSGATGSKAKIKRKKGSRRNREEKEEDRDTKYALDRTIQEIEKKSERIVRLSIALTVDKEFESELNIIGTQVKLSVGFNQKRGDGFEASTLSFHRAAKEKMPTTASWQSNLPFIKFLVKQGVIVLVVLIIVFVILRILKLSKKLEELEKSKQEQEKAIAQEKEEDKKPEKVEESLENEINKILREVQLSVSQDIENTGGSSLKKLFYEE